MARQVFYSFHYARDVMRVSQVRNIGNLVSNRPATDNNWERVKSGKSIAIKRWITAQMKGRSCTVVLVGTNTAGRPWITHEIVESWNCGMGVVGIDIHGLKNTDGLISNRGSNPFDYVDHNGSGKKLSSIVKRYNPPGINSKIKYAWIAEHLENAVIEAIRIRKAN